MGRSKTSVTHRGFRLLVLIALASGCGDDTHKQAPDAGSDAGRAGADAGPIAKDASVPKDASAPSDAALDAGHDAAHDDAGAEQDDAGPEEMTLADTGLYSDFASETLAAGVQTFSPKYALWSDGASKRRFFYLPPGTQIDTTDMDAWQFPVGTKAWKEFTRGGVRVETRLLEKTAQGWFMMAFVWNAAQTKAVAAPLGKPNANHTQHDVPASAACHSCHDGMADRLLGVSAIQLSHAKAGMTLTTLKSQTLLTAPPAGDFVLPGTQVDQDALGALHANCGHCHNPTGAASDLAAGMQLRLSTASLGSVTATTTYSTTVGVALVSKVVPGATQRIVKASPSTSGLYLRLHATRGAGGSDLAMPLIATELRDQTTETRVSDWIAGLL